MPMTSYEGKGGELVLREASRRGVFVRRIDRGHILYVDRFNEPIGLCSFCPEPLDEWGYARVPDMPERKMACPWCNEGLQVAHLDEKLRHELAAWRERAPSPLADGMSIADWWRKRLKEIAADVEETTAFRLELRGAWRGCGTMCADLMNLGLYWRPDGGRTYQIFTHHSAAKLYECP
jgi:hypothetical protein